MQQQYKLDDIPTIFVATKSDLDLAQQVRPRSPFLSLFALTWSSPQRHEVQPDTYCRKLSLRVPLALSVKRGELADLYHTIVRIAIHPCVLQSSFSIETSADPVECAQPLCAAVRT